MLSHTFAFGDNISLDTWPKTITFVANGNCYVRLRKNESTCFGNDLLVLFSLKKCHEHHSTHDEKFMKIHQFAFIQKCPALTSTALPPPHLNIQLTLNGGKVNMSMALKEVIILGSLL